MANIFRKHFQETMAAQAEAVEPSPTVHGPFAQADGMGGFIRPDAATSEAAQMLMRLTHDRSRLKMIQSEEAKIEAKRAMLPDYQNWLDGLILGQDTLIEGQPNDVLFYCMVWHIDTVDIHRALELAEVILVHKVAVPANFKRTAGCLLAEEVAEKAFSALRSGTDFDVNHIVMTQMLVDGEDMPDEVRAKLFKAEAQLAERQLDQVLESAVDGGADGPAALIPALIAQAQKAAARALELSANSGVKSLISKLERIQRKQDADTAKALAPPE